MMSRRDFNALAKALLASKKEINCEAAQKHRDVLMANLCNDLAALYPRFDRLRFGQAANGQRDVYLTPRRR